MEEKAVNKALDPEDKTSDQILADIKEKQRELKANTQPKLEESAPEPLPQTGSTEPSEQVPAEEKDKPIKSGAPSAPIESPVVQPDNGRNDEIEKWMKKKGFKGEKDVIKSYRELERELHRRSTAQPVASPQTPPQYVPQQPSYNPPPQLDVIARQYNMAPEDLERLAPLVKDMTSFEIQKAVKPFVGEIQRLEKEMARQKEIQNLEEEEAFSNPEVQFEMHRILEERPSIFQIEPAPLTYAFNEALRTLGRRHLERSGQSVSSNPLNSGKGVPNTPPPTTRGSAAAVQTPGTSELPNLATFQKLPTAKDMEKVLKSMGAIRGEDF